MRNIALKTIASFCILSALMVTSINARAQAAENMTIDIPFRFSVRGKTLPAGRYTVKRASLSVSAYTIQSRSVDGGDAVIVLALPSLNGGNAEARAKLVFNNYYGRHFLSQVWMPGSNTGNHIPQSKAERAFKRELASTNAQPQQVALLAR